MNRHTVIRRIAGAAFIAAALCSPLAAEAQHYQVVDLGVLDTTGELNQEILGDTASIGLALNNAGEVVGAAISIEGDWAAFASNGGSPVQFFPPGTEAVATAISDNSDIAGEADNAAGVDAFLLSGGSVQDLGTLGGARSQVNGMNNSDQLAGASETSAQSSGAGAKNAFLWSGEALRDLGTLGGASSMAAAINGSGEVVGAADTTSGYQHAFLWTAGGGIQDLGVLPGGLESIAFGINSSGQIAGASTELDENWHPFVWTPLGGLHDVGLPVGWARGEALAINEIGLTVGLATTPPGDPYWGLDHAMLWDSAGGIQDLNDLVPANSGWLLLRADAIDDNGEITGIGIHNGEERGVLLLPQP